MAESDWYATLELSPNASEADIAAAVERRSRQAAALANIAPERSQQLREQLRAIRRDLLSGAPARQAYDLRLRGPAPADRWPPHGQAPQGQLPHGQAPQGQLPHPQPPPHQLPPGQPPPGQPLPRRSGGLRGFLSSGWTCWNCGESAMPNDQYCTQCDAQLVARVSWTPVSVPPVHANACPYCGTLAAARHRYCRNCGAGRPGG